MKRAVLFSLSALFLSLSTQAQFGLQAGWNSSHYSWNDRGVHQRSTLQQGWSAGVLYRVGVDRLAVQPTLLFTQKGSALTTYGTAYLPGEQRGGNKLSYVQLSIPVLWRIPFHYGLYSFDIGAGPYTAVLADAVSRRPDAAGDMHTQRQPIGNDHADAFRRMDAGVTAYAGLRFHHINVSATWDQGIANISPKPGQSVHNGNLALNFGVFLYNDHTGRRYQVKQRP